MHYNSNVFFNFVLSQQVIFLIFSQAHGFAFCMMRIKVMFFLRSTLSQSNSFERRSHSIISFEKGNEWEKLPGGTIEMN